MNMEQVQTSFASAMPKFCRLYDKKRHLLPKGLKVGDKKVPTRDLYSWVTRGAFPRGLNSFSEVYLKELVIQLVDTIDESEQARSEISEYFWEVVEEPLE